MSRREHDNTGKISVAPFIKGIRGSSFDTITGVGDVYADSQKTRQTEADALDGLDLGARLTPFHKRLLVLERIALQPETHRDVSVKNRPQVGLSIGMQTWLWIASQPDIKKMNLRASDIGKFLENSSILIKARLRMEALER